MTQYRSINADFNNREFWNSAYFTKTIMTTLKKKMIEKGFVNEDTWPSSTNTTHKYGSLKWNTALFGGALY
jgi:hypothetical protein